MLSNITKSFLLLFFSFSISLYSQTLPPIQLDRPDQTECSFITPKNYIQVENGFNIENIDDNKKIYVFPTSLWKYGINEKFELRLITEVASVKENGKTITGLLPIIVGFKSSLFEENGIIPKTSFIGHVSTGSIGSKAFQTTYLAPSFRFTMQHAITEKLTLAYNLGAEWNGESAEHTYIYTLTTGLSLTDRLGCYAELYGFVPKNSTESHAFDGGFTYLINNDVILDLSGSVGLTKLSPRNYISFGFSFRFNTRKNSN